MFRRRTSIATCLAFILLVSLSRAAEPDLESGVRLETGASRLQGWAAPEVVDWDGDGFNDVVVGHYSGALSVHRNLGMGQDGFEFETVEITRSDSFRSGGTPVWAWRFNKPNCVCPGPGRISPRVLDWDGDGKKDLLIGDGQGAQIRVWRNVGSDNAPIFSTHHLSYLPPDAGVRPYHETVQPCIGDWNGDGRRDLIMGRNRGVYVYINHGSDGEPDFAFDRSRLGMKIRNVFPDERLSPAWVDWDEDGRNDLIVGSQRGEVWFARNVGSEPEPKFDGYSRVRAGGEEIDLSSEARITVADLDGDGGNDLLVGADNGRLLFFRAKRPNPVASPRRAPVRPIKPPTIAVQPARLLIGVGQTAELRVEATGTPPLRYQWSKDGNEIPRAVSPVLAIAKADAADGAEYSVVVTNAAGSASSRAAKLQVKPLPGPQADLPVIDLKYKSPVAEPATPGVLTITRTGKTSQPVTVRLTTRLAHDPVVADVHYEPVPKSITLDAGQTSAEVRVTPIDDTLKTGTRSLVFIVEPNPAYRLVRRSLVAKMIFLDDDCPQVTIAAANDGQPDANCLQSFTVTAQPTPRHDTQISYSVGGSAVRGVDYKALPGTVTIPAGKTSAAVVVQSYRQAESAREKSVILTLPLRRFTYFDFYNYLTESGPRTASVTLAPSDTDPPPQLSEVTDPSVEQLRSEVSRLGWIVFTARPGGWKSNFDLFVMRPDGSQLRNLTRTADFDEFSPRVSPDGTRLLYRRAETGRRFGPADRTQQDVGGKAARTWPSAGTLVIANLDGSNERTPGGDGKYAWATWGPQGKRIACLEEEQPEAATTNANDRGAPQKLSHRIVIRDADTLDVLKSLPSAGIHRQAVWSPDGKRICGPAEILPGRQRLSKGLEYSLGTGKLVSVDIATGKRTAMARFPDWTPVWGTDSDGDWFQGGTPQILHSANNYGICPAYHSMLWRSGLDGKPSQLVFGESMKNVWGGCTSPDDRYAIFVIGGNLWPLQGKLSIIRLADAPIARGGSALFHEVLADFFPDIKQGPVLDLNVPQGFDPQWTLADFTGRGL